MEEIERILAQFSCVIPKDFYFIVFMSVSSCGLDDSKIKNWKEFVLPNM